MRQDFLWYKLQAVEIRGQLLTAIKSLYEDVRCAVRVNQELTPLVSGVIRHEKGLYTLPHIIFGVYK